MGNFSRSVLSLLFESWRMSFIKVAVLMVLVIAAYSAPLDLAPLGEGDCNMGNGVIYKDGEQFNMGCNSCSCRGGGIGCVPMCAPYNIMCPVGQVVVEVEDPNNSCCKIKECQ